MTQRHQGPPEKIRSIMESLDEIRVDDLSAWKALAADLEKLLEAVPASAHEAQRLLQLIVEGLKRLAGGGTADLLTAVDALGYALQTAEAAMLGEASDGWSADAGARLAAAFGKRHSAEPESAACQAVSIDDAAALLVRLDPGDRAGWKRLAATLEQVAGQDSASGEAGGRRPAEEAAALCREMAGGNSADMAGCIARISALLDEAVNARDGLAPPKAACGSEVSSAVPVPEPAEAIDYMPSDPDPDLMAEFIAESTDLIQSAEEALLSLEHDPEDSEAVGKVFRAFHTIKGTAGFLELPLIAELGHHAETLLSRVRDGEIRYSGGYADLSLQALDTIKHLVTAVKRALGGEPLRKPDGYGALLEVLKNPEAAGVSEEQSEADTLRLGDILVAQGKLDRKQVEQSLSEHPEAKVGTAIVKAQAASASDVSQALRVQRQMRGSGSVMDSSVRVSTQRLDRLIDMVGELVIAYSMVAQDSLVVNSHNHGLAKKVSHANKIVRELQDISMSMRMVPLKATFGKMARLARDVARKLGKNVSFITEGEDTEIDRNLVDIINDPLVHMVRNAVDHGIETPEARRAADKPEQGTVKIDAYHSAGCVVVEISDDGKGLDREVLLAKARERGLVDDGGDLSDREVFNLILEPGFSTAETVTDVSGRGVGMDVVKKNIELLRGTVEIKSEKGAGSIFKMSLPLTLAIIDGMVIRVGRETYVIPTVSIIRSVKPGSEDVSTVLQQGEMLQLQSRLIPLYRMSRIYGIGEAQEDLRQAIVVVVEDEERCAGLVIDELIGRQQVVIKSLGEAMKNIPGISGGAIMPDGRVGLILDVGGLLRFATCGRRDECRDEAGARGPALAA
jgi:two-component system, chemotaxis family, sensor kinase CheA